MSIVRTDKWMDAGLPIEEQILTYLEMRDASLIRELRKNGMSSFNRQAEQVFSQMKKNEQWKALNDIFDRYRKQMKGPDVPVFLLPSRGNLFAAAKKSGVAFKNMVFLFIPNGISDVELEALFVHEYHHACRLHRLKGENDTLLDTLIMEGLAEKAVAEFCGEKYLAPWITGFNVKELDVLIQSSYQAHFSIKKNNSKHDDLVYGLRSVPRMAGYAVGYHLVNRYCCKKKMTTMKMLATPSLDFI